MAKVHYLKDYQPPEFTILTTELDIELEEHHAIVTGRFSGYRLQTKARDLLLYGDGQEVLMVKLDDCELTAEEYQLVDGNLIIKNVPEVFTVEIQNKIYPAKNLSLDGLYMSQGMFCTQCEPHGFRRIIYYLDRPDVMAQFKVMITADKKRYPVLLSNGNLIASEDLGYCHRMTWEDPFKKPSYLFALVAGDLASLSDHFVTRSGRRVLLEIYARHSDIDQCHYALTALKEAMHWDEVRFGREYDLDRYMIVAVSDFNMGAMENKGLNIFNTKYVLSDPLLSTDQDYRYIQAVVGHEYFHNWTGNRITCRDWFQLSLKEGLTVFRDEEFTADHHTRVVKRIEDVKIIRTAQFAEDASPMAHPIRPASYMEMNNFYTVTVYNKGAEVIRMQHTLLGDAGFRAGMDLYFQRHDGQAVTCDDFVSAMADANQFDLDQFRLWYSQAGTPEVSIRDDYDANTQTYQLFIRQSCPATPETETKLPFHIPLKLGLLGRDGKDQVNTLVSITKAEQVFTFKVGEKPIPSLFRDFSAPVKVVYPYQDQDLLFLFAHDSNAFNRWDAGQRYATQRLLALKEAYQAGQPLVRDPNLTAALAELLEDDTLEPAFVAEALLLPQEKALAEAGALIDPEAIHVAYECLFKDIATTLYALLTKIYQDLQRLSVPHHNKDASQHRMLKNVCLHYLAASGRSEGLSLAEAQFFAANTMTDRLAALTALVNYGEDRVKNRCLAQFYADYEKHALLMDKWFAIQALGKSSDTLERVKALANHPAFTIKNPNKVYALLASFLQNQARFHDRHAKGYQFIAAKIQEIDAFNGHVAARLVRGLMDYRRYVAPYREGMHQVLSDLSQQQLSPDVMEIVTKSLK